MVYYQVITYRMINNPLEDNMHITFVSHNLWQDRDEAERFGEELIDPGEKYLVIEVQVVSRS